jgi:hypothetical protein
LRIEGKIQSSGLGVISTFFICDKYNIEYFINFIVDTGASRTLVSDLDAQTIGINYGTLRKCPKPIVGITRSSPCRVMRDCSLYFKIGNSGYIEYLDSVLISESASQPIQYSLLGMDVLKRYTIRSTNSKIILEK